MELGLKKINAIPQRRVFHGSVKTRVCLADSSIIHGDLRDLSDTGAGVSGDTTGLQVGDEIWLEVLYAMIYSVKYHGEIRYINPEEGFGVKFKGKFERCLMQPSNIGNYESAMW